jgi:hypothetical protein
VKRRVRVSNRHHGIRRPSRWVRSSYGIDRDDLAAHRSPPRAAESRRLRPASTRPGTQDRSPYALKPRRLVDHTTSSGLTPQVHLFKAEV